jgi:predicted CXXCH cytochrome family protein
MGPGIRLVVLVAGCTIFRHGVLVRAAEDPDAKCAACHRAIYDRYKKTPMANASGRAIDGVIPADFRHSTSGVHYRVYEENGKVWMSYEREEPAKLATADLVPLNPLRGHQELLYFIGSGKRGRTYLFEQEGYWFESPINWYAKKRLWDMTPNHLADREMPLTLPVDPGCLHCHATGAASSLPDARNHYADVPFASGGITCEACHGDGSAHVASQGKVAVLRLEALEPVRRDSVCLNCHLEGQTAVDRQGRRPEDFKPGDNLFDFSEFFVYRGIRGSGGRATSQWEALLASECKKKSGDRMTCTTCHDPHGGPSEEDRAAFYRQRCLSCHSRTAPDGTSFAATHHPENLDCTACHMARAATSDIAHEQVTDHLIRKHITPRPGMSPATGELEAVGPAPRDREVGLAYAQMAERGDQEAGRRAIQLLIRDEEEAKGAAKDPEVHSQLGFLEQVSGQTDKAAAEYEQALQANPFDSLALGDLALIKAKQHQYVEAERLWKTAFDHDPVQTGAGLNLAIVACETGNRAEAIRTLERLLVFAPDNGQAGNLAAEIRSGKVACSPR